MRSDRQLERDRDVVRRTAEPAKSYAELPDPLHPAVTELYLDLLKRSLTNNLFGEEPDADSDDELHFMHGFIEHYIQGPAVSMLPLARFDSLQSCIVDAIERGVPGDLIETGVWRGGATIFMRAVLKAYGVTNRTVWVADSFEGLPTPDAEKFPKEAAVQQGPVMKKACKNLAAASRKCSATSKPTACSMIRSVSSKDGSRTPSRPPRSAGWQSCGSTETFMSLPVTR